jgi:hypothetical protein
MFFISTSLRVFFNLFSLSHDLIYVLCLLLIVPEVQCARSILVDEQCTDVSALLPSNFTFPAICKSVQASGDTKAHQMMIVWSVSDLGTFTRPYILQEYINHNATVFKLYVLGSEFHIVTRPSFPNLSSTPQPPIHFNSQDTKTTLPPQLQTTYAATQQPPTHDVLKRITNVIANYFRLSLFGYDVVVNAATQKLAVLDVNYFPGRSAFFPLPPPTHPPTLLFLSLLSHCFLSLSFFCDRLQGSRQFI